MENRIPILDITQELYLTGRKVIGISNDSTSARSVLNLINEKAIKDYIDDASGGSSSFIVEEIQAGEALVAGDLVYLSTDSKWYKADNLLEDKIKTELRIVKAATIALDAIGEAYVSGLIPGVGLTAGSVYYVGSGGGIITEIPETEGIFQRKVGTALSSTFLEFLPDQTYIEITLINPEAEAEVFSKTLGDVLTDTILEGEHLLASVKDVKVLNTNNAEIDVYIEYRPDNSVFIDSNYSLLNHILKIY